MPNFDELCAELRKKTDALNLPAAIKILAALPDADINKKDKFGETLLHLAARKGHNQLIELLLERKADDVVTNQQGHTPLHVAILENSEEAIRRLISAHAEIVETPDREGDAALEFAAKKGCTKAMSALFSPYAGNASTFFTYDNTHHVGENNHLNKALILAATFNRPEIISLLLDHGANIEYKSAGLTPLQHALKKSPKVVAFGAATELLERGAMPEANEKSALAFLAERAYGEKVDGYAELAELLVGRGAKVAPALAILKQDEGSFDKVQQALFDLLSTKSLSNTM